MTAPDTSRAAVEALAAKLEAMNPWSDMDWPEVKNSAAAMLRALERERDEAKSYLRAFLWATKDEEGKNAVGLHEVNPSMAWHFMMADEHTHPSYQITGGQIRRAMEIVGFDTLKEKPARQTIADELAQAMKHKRERDAALARAEAAEQMLEDACNEAWQEGHSEGMSEAQGAHADLWSMLLSHLEKHGIEPASDDGEGHSAYQMMDAIHEREAEIKARAMAGETKP